VEEIVMICMRRFLLRPGSFVLSVSLVLFLSACATTQGMISRFYVPDFSNVQDIPVQFDLAEEGTALAYRQIGDISAEKTIIIVPGSTMYGYYYIPCLKKTTIHMLFILLGKKMNSLNGRHLPGYLTTEPGSSM
jgi:hypothetical protein